MRDTVELKWDRLDLRDLKGFRIYRKLEGESRFSRLADSPAERFSFHDLGVNYGIQHAYRIAALAKSFESLPSDSVSITPGPTFTWVADASAGILIKLTHDGMHEIRRMGAFYYPFRIDIDEKRGQIWVLDKFVGTLRRLEMNGRFSDRFAELPGASDLAVDSVDASVWVADSLQGLIKFTSEGAPIDTIASFKKIAALAVHPPNAEIWALDRGSKRVLILSRTGELKNVAAVILQQPSDLDIHLQSGNVWVADGTRVLLLDSAGVEKNRFARDFRFISRLAVDQRSGSCWVIDYSRVFRESRVFKLNPNEEIIRIQEQFDIPQGLAVNPFDASCLIADTGTGRLIRISENGRLMGFYAGLDSPFDVDIAFSQ
jgi:DNA-binding beta-propeller fold protein YncE